MNGEKDTRTKANLMAAFEGESQAYTKYMLYAAQAAREGYPQIGDWFRLTAENERAHAKVWFQALRDGMPDTAAALADAAGGEHYEWSEMYVQFADEARQEGQEAMAALFEKVAAVEKTHEERFRRLLEEVKSHTVFEKADSVVWVCRNCGHLHIGTAAPSMCPICAHDRSFFEVQSSVN